MIVQNQDHRLHPNETKIMHFRPIGIHRLFIELTVCRKIRKAFIFYALFLQKLDKCHFKLHADPVIFYILLYIFCS